MLPTRRRRPRTGSPRSTPTAGVRRPGALQQGLADLYTKLIVSDDVRGRSPSARRTQQIVASPLPAVSGAPILPIIQLDTLAASPAKPPRSSTSTRPALQRPAPAALAEPQRHLAARRASRSRRCGAVARRADDRALPHRLDPRLPAVPHRHRRVTPPARVAAPEGSRAGVRRRRLRLRRGADAQGAGRRRGGRRAHAGAAARRTTMSAPAGVLGAPPPGGAGRRRMGREERRLSIVVGLGLLAVMVASAKDGQATALLGLIVVGLVVAAYQRVLLAWQTMLGVILVVILFVPIRRYMVGGGLPFELEPYRIAHRGRARVLAVRHRGGSARPLARASGLEAPIGGAPCGDAALDGREPRRASTRPERRSSRTSRSSSATSWSSTSS